eukprot:687842-Prymnesium_polylepis.1
MRDTSGEVARPRIRGWSSAYMNRNAPRGASSLAVFASGRNTVATCDAVSSAARSGVDRSRVATTYNPRSAVHVEVYSCSASALLFPPSTALSRRRVG